MSRLPCQIGPGLCAPFHSIEISPPDRVRIKLARQRLHRNCQFRYPSPRFFLQHDRAFQSTSEPSDPCWGDVEIDPQAVWTDLKFAITTLLRWIGLEKGFHYVPLPQMIASSVGLGVLEQEEFLKVALKL